jgi:hypothetical protein
VKYLRAILPVLAVMAGAFTVTHAQTTVSVTDTTGWNVWTKADGTPMSEITTDQQTGQGADDFAQDSTYPGFYQKAGTVTGLGDSILVRARFDKYDGPDQWGNGGNFGIGMDVNGDGALDLILMLSESAGNVNNRTRTLRWGDPGTGANTGPSTTSWTFPTQTATTLTVNQTYDVTQAPDSNLNGTPDMFLSFAVSFASLQAAVRAYTPFTEFTMTYETRMSYIAFTSTQANALNQDLFGTTGNTSSTLTWAELGAITGPANAWGVVPEPATYAQVGTFLLAGLGLWWRRRRQSGKVAH